MNESFQVNVAMEVVSVIVEVWLLHGRSLGAVKKCLRFIV